MNVSLVKPVLHAGQPMLVPLTSSLYVNGSISNPKGVLLDIGTGYFVEVTQNSLCDDFMTSMKYFSVPHMTIA